MARTPQRAGELGHLGRVVVRHGEGTGRAGAKSNVGGVGAHIDVCGRVADRDRSRAVRADLDRLVHRVVTDHDLPRAALKRDIARRVHVVSSTCHGRRHVAVSYEIICTYISMDS